MKRRGGTNYMKGARCLDRARHARNERQISMYVFIRCFGVKWTLGENNGLQSREFISESWSRVLRSSIASLGMDRCDGWYAVRWDVPGVEAIAALSPEVKS